VLLGCWWSFWVLVDPEKKNPRRNPKKKIEKEIEKSGKKIKTQQQSSEIFWLLMRVVVVVDGVLLLVWEEDVVLLLWWWYVGKKKIEGDWKREWGDCCVVVVSADEGEKKFWVWKNIYCFYSSFLPFFNLF